LQGNQNGNTTINLKGLLVGNPWTGINFFGGIIDVKLLWRDNRSGEIARKGGEKMGEKREEVREKCECECECE
jgi:hypothetical protein